MRFVPQHILCPVFPLPERQSKSPTSTCQPRQPILQVGPELQNRRDAPRQAPGVVIKSKPPVGCAEERSASFRSSQNIKTDTTTKPILQNRRDAPRQPPGVVIKSKPPVGCAEERSASFRSSQNIKTDTSKPTGRAPPGALLFVSRQKVSKKRLPLRGALLSRGAVEANNR
jgi:hypothetical protein